MTATLTRRRVRLTPASRVRAMLLEAAYVLHATKVVRVEPAKDGRRRPGTASRCAD
jgi:hypothetical protein